jgi:predicted regulator of Ras-like GTPase activity (Roadblock/LC7/MglB family)
MLGDLQEMSLADLLQITCAEKARARLTVRRGNENGTIYFDHGELIHAETHSHIGKAALFEMLTWPDGQFELLRGSMPPVRTLRDSCAALLLECAYLADMKQMPEGPTAWPSEESIASELERIESTLSENALPEPAHTLRRLRELPEIAGAVIADEAGAILGHDTTLDPEQLAALSVYVAAAAARIRVALGCGAFSRGAIGTPAGRLLVVATPNRRLALQLRSNAAPDLLWPRLEGRLPEGGSS